MRNPRRTPPMVAVPDLTPYRGAVAHRPTPGATRCLSSDLYWARQVRLRVRAIRVQLAERECAERAS